MKIAEFFASIGFQIKGTEQVDKVDRSMDNAARKAGMFALKLGVVEAAMLFLVKTATNASVAFKNFALQTGLSTDALQRWQHLAEVNDVTGSELADTVKRLNDVRAKFALGEPEAVGAWSLLGIDPTQNPFKVLDELRSRLLQFQDRAIAKNLANRVGISDNVFQMLIAPKNQYDAWSKNLRLTQEQIQSLRMLDASWQDLGFTLNSIKNQIAAVLAPGLRFLATVLNYLLGPVVSFVHWLKGTSMAAKIASGVIAGMAAAFVILTTVLVGLAAVISAIGLITTIFGWSSGFTELILLITLAVSALLILGSTIFLIGQDIWTYFHGGKSEFGRILNGIGEMFSYVERRFMHLVNTVKKGIKDIKNSVHLPFGSSGNMHTSMLTGWWFAPETIAEAFRNRASAVAAGNVHHETHVNVSVDGSSSPKETAHEVTKAIKDVITKSYYQGSLPNY